MSTLQPPIPNAALDILPPRGQAAIDSSNRGAVRRWLTSRGASYSQIANLTVAQLGHAYNDETDAALNMILAGTPPAAQAAAPAAAPRPPVAAPASNGHAPRDTAEALAALIATLKPEAPEIDEARIIDLIRQHAPTPEPRELRISASDRPAVTIDRQHYRFPLLLATLAARVPAYLVGPAGTGKTSAAHAAANALGLPFAAVSVGPMTSKSDLFGMRDAHGQYHESDLVKTARDGGVYLFDEFDAGNPGTLTACNMLLANGSFSTPAGMVEKHADFVPIFGLNTYGTGANREYVGRNQLDAATLDRGAFLDWPLDESLEASFVGVQLSAPSLRLDAGGIPTPAEWLRIVQETRRAVAALGLRHIISPRATIYGAQLAAAGLGIEHLRQCLLIKGLDTATAAKLGDKAAEIANNPALFAA